MINGKSCSLSSADLRADSLGQPRDLEPQLPVFVDQAA